MMRDSFKTSVKVSSSDVKACVSKIISGLKIYQIEFFIILTFSLSVSGQTSTPANCEALPSASAEKQISVPLAHCYKVELKKDEFFQVKVEQKEIDLLLQMTDSNGKELARMDSTGENEIEKFSFIAESAGIFFLELKTFDKKDENSRKGAYVIRREAKRLATVEDQKQISVEREEQRLREGIEKLLDEADEIKENVRFSKTTQPFEKSMEKARQALELANSLKKAEYQAICLFMIATIYEENEDVENAFKYYQETIKTIGNTQSNKLIIRQGVRLSLKNIGRAYLYQGMYELALNYYTKVLSDYEANEEDEDKGWILQAIGDCHRHLKNFAESEKSFSASQEIFRRLKKNLSEGITLAKWGELYAAQEDKISFAIKKLLEAEELLKNSAEKSTEYDRRVQNLSNLQFAYRRLNDLEKANYYQNQIVKLQSGIGDPDVVLISLLSAAREYEREEKFEDALNSYTAMLNFLKTYKSRDETLSKTVIYHRVVLLLLELKRGEEAQKCLDEWFNLVKDSSDVSLLARFFEALGDLEEGQDAIDLYKSGIKILLAEKPDSDNKQSGESHLKDFDLHARLFRKLGREQFYMKMTQEAINNFRLSLWCRIAFSGDDELADSLDDLMWIYSMLGKTDQAIFFGKLSIYYKQEFRHTIHSLPIDIQKSFLIGNRATYEKLVDLLIQQKRFAEVQQIINLYQDQEYYDFNSKKNEEFSLHKSSREREIFNSFQSSRNEMKDAADVFQEIKAKSLKRPLKVEEQQAMDELEPKFKGTSHLIQTLLEKIEVDFNAPAEKDKIENVGDTLNMKESLDYLNKEDKKNHAAIYTFVSKNSLNLLLITPEKDAQGKDLPIKVFSSPIKAEDLNIKIESFLYTLINKNLSPYKTGNELYKLIFQAVSLVDNKTTLEAELAKYKANVLHWSLDENLRYIPIAALSDENKKFVVEKYETPVFTRSDKESFIREPRKWEQGIGFGTSEAYKTFQKLENVPIELKEIFGDGTKKGFLNGKFLLDKDFTEKKMLDEILNAKPKNSFIHISSHFKFEAGDAQSSYLLLGAGSDEERKFSLYEMQNYTNLFQDVDLVTAAACETAGFQSNNNGREIDAFAEVAQRLGASSVIATLWKVDDAGTSRLMTEFYGLYKKRLSQGTGKLPGKSEILRDAQLNLIKLAQKDETKCNDVVTKSADIIPEVPRKGFDPFTGKPCEHPYFWAPFVLYGSSR